VVSKPQIRFKGKAQTEQKSAAHMGMWAFTGSLQRSHWGLLSSLNVFKLDAKSRSIERGDGVLKPLLKIFQNTQDRFASAFELFEQ
jgi:hypothetical protein